METPIEKTEIVNQELEVPQAVVKPRSQKTLILGIIIGFLVCFAGSVAAYYYVSNLNQKQAIRPAATEITVTASPVTDAPVSPTSGIKWLDEPQEIFGIKVFKTGSDLDQDFAFYLTDKAKFFKVAELPDGGILINSDIPLEAPGPGPIIRFIQTGDKKYLCLTSYLDEWHKKEINKLLLSSVSLDARTVDGLDSPETIDLNDKKLIRVRVLEKYFTELKNSRKVIDTPYGPVYENVQTAFEGSEVYVRGLYLKLKDTTIVSYRLKVNFYTDNGVPEIFFSANGGAKNWTAYTQALISSCSLMMVDSAPIIRNDSPLISTKKEIGRTIDGEMIYQVTDSTSQLVKLLYDNYSSNHYLPSTAPTGSISEFTNEGSYFLWKDKLGDWQIFVDKKFEIGAECGKPVIYLYPNQKTEVVVKVGALVKISEPLYPVDGWRVIAHSDGTLVLNDKKYSSLFWEGLGLGYYPDYREYGVAVPQKDLITTIKKQLALLGLNERESKDFLEFWSTKLPSSPYVRLTWFGTREMNELAPLTVTPKPDTVIRVFLEFEGLEKPKSLIPQKLTSIPRRGFILVEWGGLLLGQNK